MKGKIIKTYNGGSWIYNSKPSDFKNADVVILPGGGDWDPSLYGHEANGTRYFSKETDKRQMDLINESIESGKLLFGICRGLQGLTIRAGGFLIQDVSHPSRHQVVTKDNGIYFMNSCHHQMCYPYELPKNDYEVLSWTEGLSNRYIAGKEIQFPEIALDTNKVFKEPEVIWYPKIRALGCQGHPEWSPGRDALNYINKLIREKLKLC